jgi:hypothetical protein
MTERQGKSTPNWNIDQLRADEQAMKAAGEHWGQSVKKAPGVDGISFEALRLL